jgi:hypothetical protein
MTAFFSPSFAGCITDHAAVGVNRAGSPLIPALGDTDIRTVPQYNIYRFGELS